MPNDVPDPQELSRRRFLTGSAGLTFGLALGAGTAVSLFDARAETPELAPSAWVRITPDGTITIMAPAAEMGQGVFTSVPMLFAEEMDADWTKVVVRQADHDPKTFGNPLFGNFMVAGASGTIRGYWKKARVAGAQARRVLIDNAARNWNVPPTELSTEPGIVRHEKSGRAMTFGEIAAFAVIPAQMPGIAERDLKPRSQWRIIGSDAITRPDIPPKVNGRAEYGIDTYLPGMRYAAVLRSPVQGNGPKSFNRDDILKIRGVTDVVALDDGVAVLAESIWASLQGKDALAVTWKSGATAETYDSDKVLDEYAALARDREVEGAVAHKSGDYETAFGDAAQAIVAEYRSEHVAHATMEPMNATAWVKGDTVELWTPTQAPSLAAVTAAKIAETTPDKVTVHVPFLGGGFGRRVEQDTTVDAVTLSKATGKPVKVVWSREDDIRHDKFRPCAAQRLEAALDDTGNIVAWRHRIVADSIYARFRPQALKAGKGVDEPVVDGHQLVYDIRHQFHDYVRQDRGIDVGFWRSVGPGYTKFAVETFIDELAAAAGKDPIAYRLAMLSDARAQRVIRAAAHMAQWGRARRGGRALGIAYAGYPGFWRTHVAEIAEVSVDRATGKIRVHDVWAAVDPGVAVHPDTVVAQTEGGIVFGVSHALHEKVTIKDGAVRESNFHDYPVLRIDETPRVHVKIVASNDDAPGGMGEVALPPVAPAIANAVFALTGARLRALPFTPDSVRAAVES